MYAEARKYLMKLVHIQKTLKKKGFVRNDQPQVNEALRFVDTQLRSFPYASDDKMRSFLERHHDRIRTLIPNESYPGFRKLMNEFINLQNQ